MCGPVVKLWVDDPLIVLHALSAEGTKADVCWVLTGFSGTPRIFVDGSLVNVELEPVVETPVDVRRKACGYHTGYI